jgi:HEAT repeat protein
MYRLICTLLLALSVGIIATWSAIAQDKTPAPAAQDKPKDEKPVKETNKKAPEPPAKDKEKPAKDEKPAKEEPQESPEEQTLKAVKLPTDGPGLLDFFRKRSQDTIDQERIAKFIEQLGDKKPENRDAAFRDLVSYGLAAVPQLRRAANNLDDLDLAGLARQCLQAMEPTARAAITSAALRRLLESKASGTAEVLLAYLPFAEDERLFDEIKSTLISVGQSGDKPDPALLRALADPIPLRRALAAEILAQIGGNEVKPALRQLLQDPKPGVRLRVALALAQAQDAEAVSVLIGLLGELPHEQTRPAEDFLVQLAGEWAVSTPNGDDDVARRVRHDAWAAWWKSTEGPTLLDEFRKRTLSDSERDKGLALVPQLNDVSEDVREKALSELLSMGNGALPLLRQAANNPEAKAADRIQRSLELVDKGAQTPLPPVAARLLALRKPPGAAEALLNFLPFSEDDGMAEEIRSALAAVALSEGKVDPVLLRALEDKLPVRRAAAGEAIIQSGDKENRPAVAKLLKDADPSVRLQIGQTLLSARDKEAVPTLIALLTEGTMNQAERAEAYLAQIAVEKAPEALLGETEETRKKCRDAWAAWWKDNASKVDLAKLDAREHLLGYTLIIEQWNRGRGQGRVVEVDAKGKVRWQIENLAAPIDAQVSANGTRVVIAELNAQRIAERDLKGNILWQQGMQQPLGSQRLPGGNTLLVGRNSLMEVDREGKQVGTTISRPTNDIVAAHKFRNGQFAVVTGSGQFIRMDATGKELKTGRVTQLPYYNGGVAILPNDHVVVPLYNQNKVVESDSQGKVVWEANVQLPNAAYRLPNGNTLVSSIQSARVVEINRVGKVVWEYKENTQPIRASRR